MPTLKQIVEEQDTAQGKFFDISIQLLIIFSAITFAIETLPDLDLQVRELLNVTEVIVVAIFTVEYLLRLYFSERKLSFIFSFYGLVDLIAILPFYLAIGLDLRSLRTFRLVRVARLLKLARYSKAMQRFHTAFKIVKEEVVLFLFFALILLYLSAVGIYYFEHESQPEVFASVFHSLWWAVATLTTVGYGDIYPVTVGGKVFTFFVLVVGMGIVAVPAGLVASALTKAREMED
jgi:voltage-gated potassium channel